MVEPEMNAKLLKQSDEIQEETPNTSKITPEYTGEEQNLLLADKKSRNSDKRHDSVLTDNGVLSVPNEDPENKCRSKQFYDIDN